MKIAIVTACPSGVANSIIAAGLLQQASKTLGWEAYIECHSTVIAGHTLSEEEINKADLVILAANGKIDMQRFVGKKSTKALLPPVLPIPSVTLSKPQNKRLNSAPSRQHAVTPPPQRLFLPKNRRHYCLPNGVAHTFMAAEALEAEATRQGHQIKVETRGSVGAKTN